MPKLTTLAFGKFHGILVPEQLCLNVNTKIVLLKLQNFFYDDVYSKIVDATTNIDKLYVPQNYPIADGNDSR